MKALHVDIKNFGSTTIGARGQVVIPKEIRDQMKIKPGDKFLVFTKAGKLISLIKPENFDIMVNEMINVLEEMKKPTKKVK